MTRTGNTPKKKICYYCGSSDREMTKDHVTPKSHGGRGGSNKVDCCHPCNRAKGSMNYNEFIQWCRDIIKKHNQKT